MDPLQSSQASPRPQKRMESPTTLSGPTQAKTYFRMILCLIAFIPMFPNAHASPHASMTISWVVSRTSDGQRIKNLTTSSPQDIYYPEITFITCDLFKKGLDQGYEKN